MTRFGQTGNRFTGQPKIEKLKFTRWRKSTHDHFDVIHKLSAVGDAIAHENNPATIG
jgi:hypothetical protein